jgi:hypothetical protein
MGRERVLDQAVCDVLSLADALEKSAVDPDVWSGDAQALFEAVRRWRQAPRCIGYPDCDGDLEGEDHSAACPVANERSRCSRCGEYGGKDVSTMCRLSETTDGAHAWVWT